MRHGSRRAHYRSNMEFKIRGILVEIDVLQTLDGNGWTFSGGTFLPDEPSHQKTKHLQLRGEPSVYPTKEAAKTGARLWAERMIEQGLAP